MKTLRSMIVMGLPVIVWCLYGASLVASDKQQETGVIKDSTYTDNRFHFSAKVPFDWKEAKLKKDPTPERLMLIQRKARIPLKLQDSPEYALKPTIYVCAETTSLKPEEFWDFLQRDTVKSNFKDKVLGKSTMLSQGDPGRLDVLDKGITTIAGKNAVSIQARREYSVSVTPMGVSTPKLVRDYHVGRIYIVPFDGWLMYIECVGENQFWESLVPDFDTFVKSIKLADETPTPAPPSGSK